MVLLFHIAFFGFKVFSSCMLLTRAVITIITISTADLARFGTGGAALLGQTKRFLNGRWQPLKLWDGY